MADETRATIKAPQFDFQKKNWPEFVRKSKAYLYDGGRKARWVIELDVTIRNHLKAGMSASKQSECQMHAYVFLEGIFYSSDTSLFTNADLTQHDFASDIFAELHERYKPDGYSDIRGKEDDKKQMIATFDGNVKLYFERLINVNAELVELGKVLDDDRDCKEAGEAIFNFGRRPEATEAEQEWKGWYREHQREVDRSGAPDSIPNMRDSAMKHWEDTRRMYKISQDSQKAGEPAAFAARMQGGPKSACMEGHIKGVEAQAVEGNIRGAEARAEEGNTKAVEGHIKGVEAQAVEGNINGVEA
jgi:hypothetical protein